VPGVFQPVLISGREYVDGGLVSPVPVRAARAMGADVVIAVDISNKPRFGKTRDSIDVMLQTFAIMGQSISTYELSEADVIVRPDTSQLKATDFDNRHQAIIEGEKAGLAAITAIKRRIAEKTVTQALAR
jgi:NTE family protein